MATPQKKPSKPTKTSAADLKKVTGGVDTGVGNLAGKDKESVNPKILPCPSTPGKNVQIGDLEMG